ncbi:hypothetical protein VTO73DRAFT_1658 [Trametes versicolor]
MNTGATGPPGPAVLATDEMFWVARQPSLKTNGYDLRPRYRPGWLPSWSREQVDWLDAEDALGLPLRSNVIDAIRIEDQALVYIKKVRRDSSELHLATYLRSKELRDDPSNHCVPILDILHLPGDEDFSYLVMPFLRYIDSPAFERVDDVLECGRQLLEGLVFLHEHNIAHRDCAYKNVMMDASALYPHGHHPILHDFLANDISKRAPVLSRQAGTVKYYFIDFGISSRFASDEVNKLVLGSKGLDKSAPELSDTALYDPFELDVYLLGNLFREIFTQKYRNLRMLALLVEKMTTRDPGQRPSAQEALRVWEGVQRGTTPLARHGRLQPNNESLLVRTVKDAVHAAHYRRLLSFFLFFLFFSFCGMCLPA